MWFYDMPVWLSLPGFVLGFLLLSWAILLVLRRWVLRVSKGNAEWDRILGYAMATYGVFYGVTVALIAAGAYANFTSVDTLVLHESSSLAVLYRDASGFPAPAAEDLHTAIRDYTRFVIETDWPQQAQGIVPEDSADEVSRIQTVLFAFEPSTQAQASLQQEAIAQFNDFVEARRSRISATTLALPGMMWIVVGVGAILNAVLVGLIEVRNLRVHIIMSGLIAVFVALLIYTIAGFDHPYSGAINITPEYYEDLLQGVLAK
ncbi:DUF4239 domain-containing protein [Humibacter sp. BT305]|nr:DUF4239 domain-containing protein [Humibacter sp. BT305]